MGNGYRFSSNNACFSDVSFGFRLVKEFVDLSKVGFIMIYRSSDIPANYINIAEFSDSYIVWVRENTLLSGNKYNAYIQYIIPSIYTIFTDDYQIKSGSDYTYTPHYINNGMYSYIDYYDVEFSVSTLSVDESLISDDLYDRGDAPQIFVCQLLCVFIFVWILNQTSKLYKKGGVFTS